MSGKDFFTALRSGWWVIVVAVLGGASAACVIGLVEPPMWTSSTQLFVSTTGSETAQEIFQGGQFSQERVASYASLIVGQDLSRRVVGRLHLGMSPEDLSRQITATVVPNTVLIDVTATARSPRLAESVAGAVGAEFSTYASRLEASQANGRPSVKVTVTQAPTFPDAPSSPNTLRNIVIGSGLGLLAGALVAVALVGLDRSVKDPDTVAPLFGLPMLGVVVRDEELARAHSTDRIAGTRAVEDFRQVRNNLQFVRVDAPPKVILISSAMPGEGKTTLSINLALALADAGQRVVLLEADLRRPKLVEYLGLVGGVGLTDILVSGSSAVSAIETYNDKFSVIPCGTTPPNPGELLMSAHMGDLIDDLRTNNDFVLIDAPPLLPVADASGLAARVDGVLLSARYGVTGKDQLKHAIGALQQVRSNVLGVVVNLVPPRAARSGGYGYEYGQVSS